jgi:hypothetical protein
LQKKHPASINLFVQRAAKKCKGLSGRTSREKTDRQYAGG